MTTVPLRVRRAASLAAFVAACSSAGGEAPPLTGDLATFSDSGCKKEATGDGGGDDGDDGGGYGSPIREPLVTASDYDGLRCIEWERQADDVLTLRLLNFDGPCGASWTGRASVA